MKRAGGPEAGEADGSSGRPSVRQALVPSDWWSESHLPPQKTGGGAERPPVPMGPGGIIWRLRPWLCGRSDQRNHLLGQGGGGGGEGVPTSLCLTVSSPCSRERAWVVCPSRVEVLVWIREGGDGHGPGRWPVCRTGRRRTGSPRPRASGRPKPSPSPLSSPFLPFFFRPLPLFPPLLLPLRIFSSAFPPSRALPAPGRVVPRHLGRPGTGSPLAGRQARGGRGTPDRPPSGARVLRADRAPPPLLAGAGRHPLGRSPGPWSPSVPGRGVSARPAWCDGPAKTNNGRG